MRRSKIGWTDYSGDRWNVVTGCTPAGPGCANCYARAIYERFKYAERFGRPFSQVTMHEDKLATWATAKLPADGHKRGPGSRPMVFVCDTGDLFHEKVPDTFITRVFEAMAQRPDITFQVLTKRAARMRYHMGTLYRRPGRRPPSNVWLGVSVSDQATADERIPHLLGTPAAVRFVSIEPMLGPVWMDDNDTSYLTCMDGRPAWEDWDDRDRLIAEYDEGRRDGCCMAWLCGGEHFHGIDWVICGAESGPNRRPFDVQWALRLYRVCKAQDVPFFGKQDSGLRSGAPLVLPGVGEVKEWPSQG